MANDITLTVVGNLVADPDLRFTPTGVGLVKFAVACTPRVFDKASGSYRDGDTTFLNCTGWREMAERIAESLTKGTRVIVTGRLKQSHWETPDGDKRSAYGLDVEEIGPSLRFATATVRKLTRASAGTPGAADSWASASPTRPTTTVDEPPF